MDMKKFSNILLGSGIVFLLISLWWWYDFFSRVTKQMYMELSDTYHCLYSSDGICGIAAGIASILGKHAYSPLVFWIGALSFIIGLIIRASLKTTN